MNVNLLSGEQLVFLPGLDGTGISYEPLAPFIAPDAQVTVVKYPHESSLLSYQEIIECAAQQVPSSGESIVLAESFSGPIAIELIASGKLKAKRLVLCATFARAPMPLLLQVIRFLPLSILLTLPVPKPIAGLALGGSQFSDSLLPMWQRVKDLVSAKALAHRLRIVSRVDVRNLLPKILMPSLYIQASRDIFVPESAFEDFANGIPMLQLKKIHSPHFVLQVQPETALEIIDAWNRNATTVSSVAAKKPAKVNHVPRRSR